MNAFRDYFGRGSQGRWSAPGRVNLIGEYTDLNEGHVLPLAIPARTTVEVAARQDRLLRCVSTRDAQPSISEMAIGGNEMPSNWAAYPLAVARSLESGGHRLGGADLMVSSTVPVGAGLSSSAALECAVALALCDLFDIELTPMQTAVAAQRAEREFVGMPCGIMDQAAAMCCREGHALLLDTRDLSSVQVPLPLSGHGLELLVVDSRVEHELQASAYSRRKASCEAAAAILGVRALRDVAVDDIAGALRRVRDEGGDELARRARHVLSEERRVSELARALEAGDMASVGKVLTQGHASLRDDFEVSCAELDAIVETALAEGALGARLTGAGFGGSAVVLSPASARERLEAALVDTFRRSSWAAPSVTYVQPSDGARREA